MRAEKQNQTISMSKIMYLICKTIRKCDQIHLNNNKVQLPELVHLLMKIYIVVLDPESGSQKDNQETRFNATAMNSFIYELDHVTFFIRYSGGVREILNSTRWIFSFYYRVPRGFRAMYRVTILGFLLARVSGYEFIGCSEFQGCFNFQQWLLRFICYVYVGRFLLSQGPLLLKSEARSSETFH